MIIDDVERHARERPGARALAEIGADGTERELTWSELARESERVAHALLALGVQPGENVAFQLPNRLEFVTIALGTLRAGGVCEPLMPIFRERELAFMLRESAARVLFVPGRFRGHDYESMAAGLRSELPSLEHVVVLAERQAMPGTAAPVDPSASDVADSERGTGNIRHGAPANAQRHSATNNAAAHDTSAGDRDNADASRDAGYGAISGSGRPRKKSQTSPWSAHRKRNADPDAGDAA